MTELNSDLGGIRFGTDEDGNRGYYDDSGNLILFNKPNNSNVVAYVYTKSVADETAALSVFTPTETNPVDIFYKNASFYSGSLYFNFSYAEPNWILNVLKNCKIDNVAYAPGQSVRWSYKVSKSFTITYPD